MFPLRSRFAATRAVVLAAAACALAGCGGTNSETPWPVEPEDVDLGPEGELRTNEQLAPSGAKTAPPKSKPSATPRDEDDGKEAPKAAPRGPEPAAPSNPSTQF